MGEFMSGTDYAMFIILFALLWGFLDRQREIAVFPGWISRLGPWFDTFYTPHAPVWNPFRDAYHSFKAIIVFVLFGLVWWWFGFFNAVYMYAAWAVGQKVGLLLRKN